MRCYFSGAKKSNPFLLIPNRKPHLMISFYDMRERSNRKLLKHFIRQLRGEKERTVGSIFMDSGAYSLDKYYGPEKRGDFSFFDLEKSSEFRDYCNRYASFLRSMAEEAGSPDFFAASVDVIGNPELSRKTQDYIEERLGNCKIQAVPTVHYGSSLDHLDYYLSQKKYEMIALGGFTKCKSTKKKMEWCDAAFRRICPKSNNRMPLVKVHGFAMFEHELLCRYPFYSVDATTWYNPAVMGYVYLPYRSKEKGGWDYARKARIVNFSLRSEHRFNKGKHFINISKEVRSEVRDWLHEIGSEEFGMMGTEDSQAGYEGDWRAEANLHYWKNLEESRPDWPHPFEVKREKGVSRPLDT